MRNRFDKWRVKITRVNRPIISSYFEKKLRLLKPLINKNAKINLHTKLIIYKSLIKPMWSNGIELRDATKIPNINKIQTTQSKILHLILNAFPYISNEAIHKDLNIPTIK